MSKYDFDYIIIGSGAAGSTIALNAAQINKKRKVALIEKSFWGGTTLNSRDVPFSAALNFSHLYDRGRRSIKVGLSTANLRYNFPTARNWQALTVERAGGGNKKIFEKAGIKCFEGEAKFLGSHEISIGEKKLKSAKFAIATGSRPRLDGVEGLDKINYLTPESILDLTRLPKTICVIGGGSTGCEIAQYFAELGRKVILIESEANLLPKEDPEVGNLIGQYLIKKHGVKVLVDTTVIAVSSVKEGASRVVFKNEKVERAAIVDAVVVAMGNEPNLDLDLKKAGVRVQAGNIKVDRSLQTSARNIYAAGDVIGGESSTEKCTYEARVVVNNMVRGGRALANYAGFARVTDTYPQVSKIGLNELECLRIKRRYQKVIVPISRLTISNVTDMRIGFLKLLIDRKNVILGATAVMPEAALVTQELALAMRHGLSLKELASTPHVSNSWGEATRLAVRSLA